MRTWRRAITALATSAVLLAGTAWLSLFPYQSEARTDGLVRFSWRARGEIIERCRRQTAEELSRVPAHMRQEVVCEQGVLAPYRLRIVVGDVTIMDSLAPGSGGRSDRPMYLLREVRVAPGPQRVVVELSRQDQVGDRDDATEKELEGGRTRARTLRQRAIPRDLALDTVVTLGSREVALVTYDSEKRRLVLIRE